MRPHARPPHPGPRPPLDPAVARTLRHWRQEMDSAALFEGLAEIERHPRRDRVYLRMAVVERGHARALAEEMAAAGVVPPAFAASLRTRALLFLARRLGTAAVLPQVARLEAADARGYAGDRADGSPADEERANALWLAEFAANESAEAAKRLLLRLRRIVIAVVGVSLCGVSLALLRNAQLEGLWFGLLTGVAVGPVIHYALGKLAIPLAAGRVWCGWACWTAALLDQLPYRRSPGVPPGGAGRLRALHLVGSLAVVAVLVLAFGVRDGAVGARAGWWFAAGNALYWGMGVALAVALRDNRAFCKVACPVSVILRLTARPALVKVAGDADACRDCVSRACLATCPMDVDVPAYVGAGRRVLASECIACLQCVAVCPPNTLRLSVGLDLGGRDRLQVAGGPAAPAGTAAGPAVSPPP